MTYRQFVYERMEATKKYLDDSSVLLPQFIYYSVIAINSIMQKRIQKMKHATGAYLNFFDVNVTLNVNGGWYEFDLPAEIFDIERDLGINFIAYNKKSNGRWLCTMFERINPDAVWRLKLSPYECPLPSRPYFYRTGNAVHLIGVETITISTVTVGLLTTIPVNLQMDLDQEIPLDTPHIAYAIMLTEELMKFGLVITPDKFNDGTDLSERLNSFPELLKQSASRQMLAEPQQQQDGNS